MFIHKKRWMLLLLVLGLLLVGAIMPLTGQADEEIITVAVPGWMSDVFDEDLFEPFEEQFPGVKVVPVFSDDLYLTPPAFDMEAYQEEVDAFASMADVLYLSSWTLRPELIRGGYLLDLNPLIMSDTALDTDDFIQPALESYQWDGGTWGLPITATVNVLVYAADAFDEAGLAYPDASWSFSDFLNAARELTVYDADGSVELPGYMGGIYQLISAVEGIRFYDPNTLPAEPSFTDPALVPLIEEYQAYQQEVFGDPDPEAGPRQYDWNNVPLSITGAWRLNNNNPDNERDWQASLLPGGTAVLSAEGFGVSAGTENPELAYEFIKYMTTDPTLVNRFFGDAPARRSMIGVEAEDDTFFGPEISEDTQAIIDQAVEVALPATHFYYQDYLSQGVGNAMEQDGDILAALEQAEQDARETLADIEGQADQILVATPVPTPVVAEDQIVLRFGIPTNPTNLPNEERWDQVIEEFVAEYPLVGNVELVSPDFGALAEEREIDCEFINYNPVPSSTDAEQLTERYLDLKPFMDADPDFNDEDFIGPTLAQLTKDGRVFGYPLTIQPAIMWYDTARFEEAGVPGPQGGWMVDQFRDALEQLDPTLNDDIAPFKPQDYGNHYLLLLMASYGGIPYDRSTDPPTINFDDQVALDAARQVLDLAREGYIDYQPLGESSGVSYGGPQESPVIADRLTFWNWRLQDRDENPQMEDFLLTVYPRGSQYIPASYDVSAAYIHPESRSPEACYRFISELAQTPDLFIGMPPRRSLIDDPSIADWLGEDALVLYQDYAEVLEAPNILVLPQGSASAGAWIEETWVNQAFDAYVVDNVELETAFEEARENILTYRECIEPYKDQDTTDFEEQEEWMAFTRQFTDCAITIDPDLREQFLFYYQDEDE